MFNANDAPRKQIHAVVVNFNASELLVRAVSSLLASVDIGVEVSVVDNGSTDNSVAQLHQCIGQDARLRVVENNRNLGFARATNIGMRDAACEFVLVVNPDCIVAPDTISRLLKHLEQRPDVGMAGCLILNPDGSEQAGARRAHPTPWRTLVRVLHLDKMFARHPRFRTFLLHQEPLPEQPIEVEAISGAFMLVRRAAIEQVGMLDEGYFLHCEDLDWCMRFRQAGWKILFVPDVEVVHHKGTCSKDRPLFVLWHKHRGMVRYYRKFFRHQYPAPLMVGVIAAVWIRFAVLALVTVVRPRPVRRAN